MNGKVWLVGAGPSDAELLTIKGKRLLRQADVVVYDRLVGAGVLAMIPPGTRTIDVGKRAADHPVPQEEINEILIREAQAGKRVVRLKGGDPFLFGRGGEELEGLKKNGIPFEVVPGIPSAIAVPAYAGIPVTHRDYCSSLHIITGHTRQAAKPRVDYEALARLNGTLVFLMGLSALDEICNGLIIGGMSPQMPAAIIEEGTSAVQRSVVTTLQQLPKRALEEQLHSPALIVIGKVCELAEQFGWAQKRELNGVSVTVTRPQKRASKLSQKLTALGAEVIELPAIQTTEILDNPLLQKAFQNLTAYSWVVFTSCAGVECFFHQLLTAGIDLRKLAHLKFAAIGDATGQELRDHGIIPDFVPEQYYASALAEGLVTILQKTDRLLIPRAKEGTQEVSEILSNNGIGFDDIPVYETGYCTDYPERLIESIRLGSHDYVAFTSASTVRGFVRMVGKDFPLRKVKAICIGEQTASEASKYQMDIYLSERQTIDSMVDCIRSLARR